MFHHKPLYFFFLIFSCQLAEAVTIKLDKSTVNIGEQFNVELIDAPALNDMGWVGIIPSNVEHGSESVNDQHDVAYHYLYGKVKFAFSAPQKPGRYDVRLNNSGKELASTSFEVKAVDTSKIDMTLSNQSVGPGKSIIVDLKSSLSLPPQAWLGIVPSSVPHGDGRKIDEHDIAYQYLGETPVKTYSFAAPEKSGSYDIRLVSANYSGIELASRTFIVTAIDTSKLTLSLNKQEFDAGERITLSFSGTDELSPRAWVGVVPSNIPHGDAKVNDKHDLDYRYMNNRKEGSFSFIAPSTKGKYDFRIHDTEYGNEVAHVSFAINQSLDAGRIKETLDKEGKISLYGIYFDTDKAIIKASSYPVLEELVKLLSENKDFVIDIEGHTDNQGDADYNINLSAQRALAVKTFLVSKGIESTRLFTKGLGETAPVADNASEAGRALNRRVDIIKR